MTTIGSSLVIKGHLTSREDITIHGQVKGQIAMETGSLLIAPNANVEADVQGTHMTIHGTFAGDIAVADRVELTATANVRGTLLAPSIVLQDGALFNGSIEVDRRAKGTVAALKPAGETVAKAS